MRYKKIGSCSICEKKLWDDDDYSSGTYDGTSFQKAHNDCVLIFLLNNESVKKDRIKKGIFTEAEILSLKLRLL